jgi:hypothetical protein
MRWGKTGWGSRYTDLGEFISPKNSKIPWRNQGIANGGLGVTLTVVLERLGVRSERIGEG